MIKNHKYTCCIVDDEQTARYGLRTYINRTASLICVGEFKNVYELDTFLKNNLSPDIIFIDIQMPVMSGLDYVASATVNSIIIIVTAFEQYAVSGFDLNVCDYLLKPVPYQRFMKAVEKAIHILEYSSELSLGNYLFVKTDRIIRRVFISDIICLEALENYVRLHAASDRLVTRSTLKTILSKLPGGKFAQIHKSFVVNLMHISAVMSDSVQLDNGTELPLSKIYKDSFLQSLNLYYN